MATKKKEVEKKVPVEEVAEEPAVVMDSIEKEEFPMPPANPPFRSAVERILMEMLVGRPPSTVLNARDAEGGVDRKILIKLVGLVCDYLVRHEQKSSF